MTLQPFNQWSFFSAYEASWSCPQRFSGRGLCGQLAEGAASGVESTYSKRNVCIAAYYMLYVVIRFGIPLPLEVQFQTKKWTFSLGHVRRIPFLDVFQVFLFNTMITHHFAPPFGRIFVGFFSQALTTQTIPNAFFYGHLKGIPS